VKEINPNYCPIPSKK